MIIKVVSLQINLLRINCETDYKAVFIKFWLHLLILIYHFHCCVIRPDGEQSLSRTTIQVWDDSLNLNSAQAIYNAIR